MRPWLFDGRLFRAARCITMQRTATLTLNHALLCSRSLVAESRRDDTRPSLLVLGY